MRYACSASSAAASIRPWSSASWASIRCATHTFESSASARRASLAASTGRPTILSRGARFATRTGSVGLIVTERRMTVRAESSRPTTFRNWAYVM